MKIVYERSGGFAGITRHAEVDTEALAADLRAQWENLVNSAQFFARPAKIGPGAARDAFVHHIRVEAGARVHTVEVQGTGGDAELKALVARLDAASRSAT